MSLAILVSVMIAALAPVPVPDPSLPGSDQVGIKFSGGDHDGLSIGWKVDRNGKTYVGMMPSKPNASPLPADIAPIVNGLIDAYKKGDRSQYAEFVSPTAKTYLTCLGCGQGISFFEHDFRVKREENLTLNTPFLLPRYSLTPPNEHSVRLEWLHDGQLWYTSQVIISDGKVANVITSIPRPIITSPPPPKAGNERG